MSRRIRSIKPELLPCASHWHVGFVYFFRAPNGHIKIGFSRAPMLRLPEVERDVGEPLECIGFFVGKRLDEHRLHRMFSPSPVGREWFMPTDDLLSLVESLRGCPYGLG